MKNILAKVFDFPNGQVLVMLELLPKDKPEEGMIFLVISKVLIDSSLSTSMHEVESFEIAQDLINKFNEQDAQSMFEKHADAYMQVQQKLRENGDTPFKGEFEFDTNNLTKH